MRVQILSDYVDLADSMCNNLAERRREEKSSNDPFMNILFLMSQIKNKKFKANRPWTLSYGPNFEV
jgi:hypothetical protein